MDLLTISPFLFFMLMIVFLTVDFLSADVKIVPQAEEWTIERFAVLSAPSRWVCISSPRSSKKPVAN